MRARHLFLFVVILPVLLVASACSGDSGGGSGGGTTNQTKPSTTDVPLEGTNWVLNNRSDVGDLEQVAVTAEFTADSMSGSSGCNTYRAPIARDDPKIEVTGAIAVTQMACIGGPTGAERAYLATLPKVRTYGISGDRLTLRNLDGKALLMYRASGITDIQGDWTATSIYTGNAIQSVTLGTEITARFTTDVVSGNGGCNGYSGPAKITGSTVALGPFVTTLMNCVDPAGSQEQQYLAALELARTWEVVGNRLTLFREGGTIAATFERA